MHYIDHGAVDNSGNHLILRPFSDLHVGHPSARLPLLQRAIAEVEGTPEMYVLLCGDLAEAAVKHSKGDPYVSRSPQEELEILESLFAPVRHKILGVVPGNHEQRVWNQTGVDMTKNLMKALGVPLKYYSPETLIVQANCGKPNRTIPYLIHMAHGWSGGSTTEKWQKARDQQRLIENCDVYISGHIHDAMATPSVRQWVDTRNHKISSAVYWTIVNGSFVPDADYAEKAGYKATAVMVWDIHLSGITRHIEVHGTVFE